MYVITSGTSILHSPMYIDDGNVVSQPIVTEELNKAASLTFTVPPTNPEYNSIRKLKSIVEVHDGGSELFRGRVLDDLKDFYNKKSVYCEGELAFLHDSVMRPYDYTGGVSGFFEMIINNHNDQVEDVKQFALGNVTVTDPNNTIVRANSSHSSSWDCIKSKLLDMLGGYVRVRVSDNIRYIDYVSSYVSLALQDIEFGVNLLDITQYVNSGEIYTALIPTGKDGLDIKSVNGGLDYIYNQSAADMFGWIWKQKTWEDVTIASNLLSKANDYIADGADLLSTVTIKAIDLSLTDAQIGRLSIGSSVWVKSVPHDIYTSMMVSKIVRNLEDPSKTEVTLGRTYKTSTDIMLAQNATAGR